MPDEEDEEREEPKLSKKERKSRNKLSVAELKVRPTITATGVKVTS